MCDCYYHKCQTCNNQISVHIADFCVKRKALKAYCPACVTKQVRVRRDKTMGDTTSDRGVRVHRGHVRVFADAVTYKHQIYSVMGKPIGKNGQVVIFVCSDMRAYGIRLN